MLELIGDFQLEAIVGFHQGLDLVVQILMLLLLFLLSFLELFLEVSLRGFFFLQEFGDFLLESLTRFLKTFSLRQQGVIHIFQLLQFLVKFLIILHLLHISLLLVRSLVVLHERNILLFELLEFRVLALQFLAFGTERHDLLFLLLEIFLLFLEFFLVFGLTMVNLFHLALFLFKEFLVVVQLVRQSFDFFLLFFELRPHRIVLGLRHAHRFLDHFEILD